MSHRRSFLFSMGMGFAVGYLGSRSRRIEQGISYEEAGAVSAVTGGHPEEMNEMPPNITQEEKATVFDGSDLV
jgi:hypothetical protein